jgi:hypothetical protein
MSRAIPGFANWGKIAVAFWAVGLVVICIPSPSTGQDAGQRNAILGTIGSSEIASTMATSAADLAHDGSGKRLCVAE